MGRLDVWTLPKPKSRPWISLPVVKWAAAASVVFGLGLVLGIVGGRWGQRQAFAQEMAPLIRQELQQQLREDWRAELSNWQEQVSTEMMRVQNAAAQATRQDVSLLLTQWAQKIQSARTEDQQNNLKLWQQMEARHETDIAWLRRDLETVALQADGEFRLTRHKLGQLVLASQPSVFPLDSTSPERMEQN
jgi:hypothetical protein